MFDLSFLPEADLEFVVMTDTHYMLDPGGNRVEFESRRRQAARAEHALQLIASLDVSFVVHGGDLVQEFPESAGFAESVAEALRQFARAEVKPYQVAGNHDVGDKPDPTMPTDWATPNSLSHYHERFGNSWYGWNAGGCHFVVLNSQIMNGPLPEAAAQQRWLDEDLAAHDGMPTYLFTHLAPFLCRADEQALGHYDNIDEPARSWLLGLIRKHDVRMIFSGHSHFSFFNRTGDARFRVVPSTAFTRPGFCEVFSSAPPPERGRDDVAKLGFLLVRVRQGAASVHLIRTNGATSDTDGAHDGRRIVTRTSRDFDRSPLGITLRHPLALSAEVPIAWQSTIRQPVRNDYPLLACVELGVRHVRVPAGDLANVQQRERLAVLRDEGVAITATWIWSERSSFAEEVAEHRDILDGVEVQLPGRLQPDASCLQAITDCADVPVAIAPLLPREIVPGKQHARTRIGYHLDELSSLDQFLHEHDAHIARVLCRVDANEVPWDAIHRLREQPALNRIGAIDWAIEFGESDEQAQVERAATALSAMATVGDARLFMEPLVDLDRTMDAPLGLLDRLCNPRSVFNVVRVLNTMLFGTSQEWKPFAAEVGADVNSFGLQGAGRTLVLMVPNLSSASVRVDAIRQLVPNATKVSLIDLVAGTSGSLDLEESHAIDVREAVLVELA